MMISVLYFYDIVSIHVFFQQLNCLIVLPDHFMLMNLTLYGPMTLVIFVSGSGPWPDGSQSPLPETLMALNEENMKNTLLRVP